MIIVKVITSYVIIVKVITSYVIIVKVITSYVIIVKVITSYVIIVKVKILNDSYVEGTQHNSVVQISPTQSVVSASSISCPEGHS